MATIRAARDSVSRSTGRTRAARVRATATGPTHYIEALDDALSDHDYSDGYIALLSAALDAKRNVHAAIEVANAAA